VYKTWLAPPQNPWDTIW